MFQLAAIDTRKALRADLPPHTEIRSSLSSHFKSAAMEKQTKQIRWTRHQVAGIYFILHLLGK